MLPKSFLLLLLVSFIEAERSISDSKSFSPQPCPKPKLDNGRVRIKQRSSRLVKFMCAPRYTLVGNRYATCRNGKWDVPIPVCVRAGCDDLPIVPHSIHVKEQQDAWRVYFCFPGYKIVGSPAVFCDGYNWNDTAPACIDEASSTPSLSCDFEDPNLCGWTQDELHDFDWQRWNKKTPSSFVFTGPSYDHTHGENGSGFYMLIESTAEAVNATARLLSPVYDKSLTVDGCFRFYLHMFGRTIGGLRVYQKPASVPLYNLLKPRADDPDTGYLLFEQFGELGNAWFSSVPVLRKLDEDFQIVIEGIRGSSYTSDIAVDDVAILQGRECDLARLEAATVTPNPELLAQTCAGRCGRAPPPPAQCACSSGCFLQGGCCPDFYDVCVYGPSDSSSTSDDALPETQKLVGETTTTTKQPITTTKQPTTTSTTPASTTKTKPPTTPTTTLKTTSKPTTPKPTIKTTPKPTTTRATPTTTNPTTPKPTAKTTKSTSTTSKPTTSTSKPTTSTSKTTTSTSKTTEGKVSTKLPTTTLNVMDESIIEKSKLETEITLNKKGMDSLKNKSDSIPTSSPRNTAVITIVVLSLCSCLIYLGVQLRTARGRQLLARLRGRTASDPEVTYLNAAVDEDL